MMLFIRTMIVPTSKGCWSISSTQEWPFLLKVLSFLVEFITPIIKATNNQSIAVKAFYFIARL